MTVPLFGVGQQRHPETRSTPATRLAVELGVKFTPDVNGAVNGVRFYKSAGNTGTHVGNLWTAGGQLLGTATFSVGDRHRLATGQLPDARRT